MKKIIGIFSLLIGILLLAACGKDEMENPYAVEKTITIDSAKVLFQAAPSTGTIHVNAVKGITKVESEKPWCQTAVDGNQVTVTVSQNYGMESRASLVKIYSGDSYASVTVQQMGTIVALDVTNIVADKDTAQTLTYNIKHNVDVTFSTTADWIKVTEADDKLNVTLTENTTGKLRKGFIYYTDGNTTDSISVLQCEFEKDIMGDYSLYYMDATAKWQALPAKITADSIFVSLDKDIVMGMAYTYNAKECQLEVNAGQYIGTYNNNFIYLCYRYEKGTWSGYGGKSVSFAKFDLDPKSGAQTAEVNSTASNNPFMAWAFRAFKAKEMTANNNIGYLLTLYFPIFEKITDSGAKAANQAGSPVHNR